MKTIAVTGATGLVGQFLLSELSKASYQVIAIKRSTSVELPDTERTTWEECDISDQNGLEKIFSKASVVIHAAGMVSFNPRDRGELFRTNVDGTKSVVNACLNAGVQRLLHVSSVAAFGRQKGHNLITEDSRWVESDLNTLYAESKYLAELEVFRGQEEGLQVDMINPSVILAPQEQFRSSASIFRYVLKGGIFYTPGSINYVDARDVAEIALKILDREATGSRWIVNAGHIEIGELFAQIGNRLNKKAPSLSVPIGLLTPIAWLEAIRSFATGNPPLITSQSAKIARENFVYSSEKVRDALNHTFRPPSETLDWCCEHYRSAYNKQSIPAS